MGTKHKQQRRKQLARKAAGIASPKAVGVERVLGRVEGVLLALHWVLVDVVALLVACRMR